MNDIKVWRNRICAFFIKWRESEKSSWEHIISRCITLLTSKNVISIKCEAVEKWFTKLTVEKHFNTPDNKLSCFKTITIFLFQIFHRKLLMKIKKHSLVFMTQLIIRLFQSDKQYFVSFFYVKEPGKSRLAEFLLLFS